ncbi:MAG TPA: pyridoxal phosphate-dependent aminotransferase [Chloroflexota bacterium]|nr:pyridoxal phosphate-dependent aminotransferase [Chloroflexota bacterium]
MKAISHDIRAIPSSGIREMQGLALTMPDAIHLEIGDPDFDTPEHIAAAAQRAMRDGWTRYTATTGLLSLREALCDKLAKRNGIRATPDEVVVTAGSTSGLAVVIRALCDPGDEVLVPDPGWPNYMMMCTGARALPVRYPLDPSAGFQPDVQRLEQLITPRTKVLLINSPSNPTGCVFTRDAMLALVEFAQRHDLYLIADEVYEEIVFEGEHVSPFNLTEEPRVISVFSFSKTYAMTGWRLGYLVASEEIVANCNKVQEGYVACASAISQKAAEAALAGPQECVAAMRAAYQRRRDIACALLRQHSATFYTPRGAFYLMIDARADTADDMAFCKSLLQQERVALAPGSTFGDVSRGWVRVSLAAGEANIRTGISKVAERLAQPALQR